jgi:hypothetical protein
MLHLEQIQNYLLNKSKDFEHLLFNKDNKEKILHFSEFVRLLN